MASSHLRDPDLRRLRALGMIDMKIRGKNYREIAKEFNVSENTVERTLSWAKKAQLVVDAEDKILQELVPAAHTALLKALAGEDAEVAAKSALEIFKGVLPAFKKAPTHGGSAGGAQDDLSSYINTLRNDLLAEGEVIPSGSSQRALPPATAEIAPSGLPEGASGDGSAAE